MLMLQDLTYDTISQHCCHQATSHYRANVDPGLCRHLAPLRHPDLKCAMRPSIENLLYHIIILELCNHTYD